MLEDILKRDSIQKAFLGFLAILILFFLAKTVNEFKAYQFVGAGKEPVATISVSGEGEVNIAPDTATFTFTVREEGDDVETIQSRVSEKISSIIDRLEDEDVDEKDIRTEGYNIHPQYEYRTESVICPQGSECYPPSGKRTFVGYEVSQTVKVKVREIDNAGEILTALGSLNVDNLYGPNFEVENEDEVLEEAREKAIADAKSKADALAKQLGVSLGRVVSFHEGGRGPVYFDAMESKALGMGGGDDGSVAEIPTGENTVRSNVNIIYEIR